MVARDFGVLGPLYAVVDGRPVPVAQPKLRVVLATLLTNANATVTLGQVVERLWGEHPPRTARKTVHLYVSRLRRLLGLPDLIRTRPEGYLLQLEEDELDLGRFVAARRRAELARDPRERARHLDEALACWRGPALADVPSESLQREVVALLAEERLRVVEWRMQTYLDLGRHAEIVAELVQLTKDHPWQEPLWAQLVLALHRSGRTGDAVDTFHTVRSRLRVELGVEPGEHLRRAHREILTERGEPPVNQLPAGTRGFVGRRDEVARLTRLLQPDDDSTPVVVVSGPPGVGKTALSVRVAHRVRSRFPDGQLYVDMRAHAPDPPLSAGDVLGRFLGALGVPPAGIPADQDERAARYRSLLAGRNMLVLLDNVASPELVRRLLPGVPGCAVLVTSRYDLRGLDASQGVDHVPLGVLSPAESVEVLANLVGPARAAAEPGALADLADACAHLALALRIAGAILAADPHLCVAAFTGELRAAGRLNRLVIDNDEESAVLAAFRHSYRWLRAADQRLFRRLGELPCGLFTAAEAGSGPEIGRGLDRLVAAGLLHRHDCGRYELHDLLREFAAEHAPADAGDTELLPA